MALSDSIFEILQHTGSAVGAGGGFVAAEVYRRLRSAIKDAKEARRLVEEILKKDFVSKHEFQRALERLARGSRPEIIGTDPLVAQRLQELERRMSEIEDDLDNSKQRDREWAETIQKTLGKIEGMMNRYGG